MSGGERRIAETQGRFLPTVESGGEVEDARWETGRLLLSNRRLVLVGGEGKRTIPLADVDEIGVEGDVGEAETRAPEVASLRTGEEVFLLAAGDHGAFEVDLCSAALDGETLLVRHPTVEVDENAGARDTDWEKVRLTAGDDGTIHVVSSDGTSLGIAPDDVLDVAVTERTVRDRSMRVVEFEHVNRGTDVETHLAGPSRACSLLETFLGLGAKGSGGEVDLDETEREVLMALYSGISSFEIPEFTGADVDEVEDTFERLVEQGVLDEVRRRREVALTPRGRNLASDAIGDE